jgi:hypothetical protein
MDGKTIPQVGDAFHRDTDPVVAWDASGGRPTQ